MVNSFPFDQDKYPNCREGHQYALDIVSGKIVACEFVIGACKRYLRDVNKVDHPRFYFSPDKAEHYMKTTQRFQHVIGVGWKSTYILYEPWQKFFWMNIMGFVNRNTGFRRFRIAHMEVSRGNGKSALASQAALYFMALDNPNGNQVATAATKKEQARIVLDSAQAMARKNKSFLKHTGVEVRAHDIVQKSTNSKIRALSAEAGSLDGLNDVLAICDELHAMKRETFEVIYSGMSKRADSLTLCITTAGFDIDSIGYSQSEYAKRLCTGDVEDDQFFAIVYTLDKDDDMYEEKNWIKSNPNLGVSVDIESFRAKALKTRESPADKPNFMVKHLNVWVDHMDPFYDTAMWDKCADKTLNIKDFLNKPVHMGIDLASKIDLTSVVLIFKKDGIYYVFDYNYIPEDTVKELRSVLYDEAIERKELIATQGAAINNEYIRKQIEEQAKLYRVGQAMYDSWNATEMAQQLANKVEVVKFPMTTANLSEPMKKLDALMREGRIRHNGSKLLRWSVGNVVAKRDANDNVFPRKTHEKFKIDPVVATIMALAAWLRDDVKETVYSSRGIRSI